MKFGFWCHTPAKFNSSPLKMIRVPCSLPTIIFLELILNSLEVYFKRPGGCPSQAVHLLSMSKQFEKAVQLCAEHDVQITEEMAERMTPEKCRGSTEWVQDEAHPKSPVSCYVSGFKEKKGKTKRKTYPNHIGGFLFYNAYESYVHMYIYIHT